MDLKRLLGIETDEFDESIMTFEEKEGVFEKSNRCYFSNGIAPTITSVSADEKIIEPAIIEDFYKNRDERVYKDVAPTLRGERNGLKVAEPLAYDEQNQYIRKDGTVGTLTTDGSSPKHNNRVIEPMVWDGFNQRVRADSSTVGTLTRNCGADLKRNGQGIIEPIIVREEPLEREGWHRHAKEVLNSSGLCRTLAAQSNNLVTKIKEPYSLRIRKLTPKECWRLMGFDDADFEKAEAVNSNSQLYKQAGNSIVVDVLTAIFSKLF
jgi:DNA (cytosine-5)-methyltransferase 1